MRGKLNKKLLDSFFSAATFRKRASPPAKGGHSKLHEGQARSGADSSAARARTGARSRHRLPCALSFRARNQEVWEGGSTHVCVEPQTSTRSLVARPMGQGPVLCWLHDHTLDRNNFRVVFAPPSPDCAEASWARLKRCAPHRLRPSNAAPLQKQTGSSD